MRDMPILSNAKNVLDTVATIAIVIAASVFVWTKFREPASARPASVPQLIVDVNERIPADKLTHMRGNGDVVLVEFADYQCPFCAKHSVETAPLIERELISAGKLRHTFFHFPLTQIHADAFTASEAAECAGHQGKFWEMHERLFANRLALKRPDLVAYATALKLEVPQFEKCLAGETSERVRSDVEEGKRLGVTGTPAFFLATLEKDGSLQLIRKISGAASYETFKSEAEAISPTHVARRK